MNVRIAVASVSLRAGFPALVYAQIKRVLQPHQSLVECATIRQDDPEFARPRILGLLAGVPKPVALIGISVRPDEVALATLRDAGVPVLLIDESAPGASTVAIDNFAGGYLAGQHLARAGRRALRVVCGDRSVSGGYNAQLRVNGFAKAMAEHRLRFTPADVHEAPEYSRKDGQAIMARILDERRPVDAVFCAAGDTCAMGLLATARERGVKVPEQLALVGYDDLPTASISDPPLTTLRQPLEQLAREAVRLATEHTAELLASPQSLLIAPVLVQRASA